MPKSQDKIISLRDPPTYVPPRDLSRDFASAVAAMHFRRINSSLLGSWTFQFSHHFTLASPILRKSANCRWLIFRDIRKALISALVNRLSFSR